MANYEYEELVHLRRCIMSNSEVPIKIAQKYEGIKQINRSGRTDYPAPQLKPPGAPAFQPQKNVQGQLRQELQQKVKAFEEQMNKEIIEIVHADFEKNYSGDLERLNQLPNKDVIDLLEIGPEKVLDNQKQREHSKERVKSYDSFNQNKSDIAQSIKMSEIESDQFFSRLEPYSNLEDRSRELNKSDGQEPTKE